MRVTLDDPVPPVRLDVTLLGAHRGDGNHRRAAADEWFIELDEPLGERRISAEARFGTGAT